MTARARPAKPPTLTVKVLPRFRLLHGGRVYEAGEVAELPLLTALQWKAWGSVRLLDNE